MHECPKREADVVTKCASDECSSSGGRLLDCRTVNVPVPPERAFEPIRRIGGNTGWYYANWLWKLRGVLDILVGGVGLRRGRADPDALRVGDPVDCWRVEALEPNRLLRLAAEMKLPGCGWLEFEVTGNGAYSTIRQTAIYHPRGLVGLAYWYVLWPVHHLVFSGMLRGIAAKGVLSPHQPTGDRGSLSGEQG